MLRWLNLAGKPLWMDEVITALFSYGQSYDAIPVEQVMPVADSIQFLRFRPAATCPEIAANVMMQSVHPPLFFCALHSWLAMLQNLGWPSPSGGAGVWQLRSLAAVFGTGAIGLIDRLMCSAFRSPPAARWGAWVMAVSPFAVYLSQEARHYTLPMVVVMLGLLGLLKIQQDWQQGQINPWIWMGWAATQTLGFYIHYFCLLATVAQVGALLLWQYWYRSSRLRSGLPPGRGMLWVPLAFTVSAIGFTYVPWLPIFLRHMNGPETNWLRPFAPSLLTLLAPLWQLPIGWLSMIMAFPIDHQPIWLVVPTAIAMLLFAVWIVQPAWEGFCQLWRCPESQNSTVLLTGFLAIVMIEFGAIIFIFQKDITQVPRYNFIYYPVVCMLLAASLALKRPDRRASIGANPLVYLVLIGILSSLLVNANLVFQKPFEPAQVAANITQSQASTIGQAATIGQASTLVVMGYMNDQELALGLSFVLSLRALSPHTQFAFLARSSGYAAVIQQLATLSQVQDFWLIAPGLRQRDFPAQMQVGPVNCRLVPDRYHRIGIPYQGYQCPPI